jgi:hypothetical protein
VTRPSRSPRVAELWGVSATTFLVLCIAFGPHRAVTWIVVAAIAGGFVALCRRFPMVGAFAVLVMCNLVSGGR